MHWPAPAARTAASFLSVRAAAALRCELNRESAPARQRSFTPWPALRVIRVLPIWSLQRSRALVECPASWAPETRRRRWSWTLCCATARTRSSTTERRSNLCRIQIPRTLPARQEHGRWAAGGGRRFRIVFLRLPFRRPRARFGPCLRPSGYGR